MSGPRCIGYGKYEGSCDRPPDTVLNGSGLWCTRCEKARRAHISAQMADITKGFEPPVPISTDGRKHR